MSKEGINRIIKKKKPIQKNRKEEKENRILGTNGKQITRW